MTRGDSAVSEGSSGRDEDNAFRLLFLFLIRRLQEFCPLFERGGSGALRGLFLHYSCLKACVSI